MTKDRAACADCKDVVCIQFGGNRRIMGSLKTGRTTQLKGDIQDCMLRKDFNMFDWWRRQQDKPRPNTSSSRDRSIF